MKIHIYKNQRYKGTPSGTITCAGCDFRANFTKCSSFLYSFPERIFSCKSTVWTKVKIDEILNEL